VIAAKSKNITQANIDPDTQVGMVCFTGLSFTPKDVMVAAQSVFDGGQQDVFATAYVSLGTVSTGDCSGKLEVRTFDISDNARADRPFHIWFED
jgi:nucleoside-specific outer membrane channel protein Tsx